MLRALYTRILRLFHKPSLWDIPEWASAARREALARKKHQRVREHQKDKQRALHRALMINKGEME